MLPLVLDFNRHALLSALVQDLWRRGASMKGCGSAEDLMTITLAAARQGVATGIIYTTEESKGHTV